MLSKALSSCKTLATVVFGKEVTSINKTALANAGIQKAVFSDGMETVFSEKYLYDCIGEGENFGFSYLKLAQQIQKVSTEVKRYSMAMDLLYNHAEKVDSETPALMDIAVSYLTKRKANKKLAQLMDLHLDHRTSD